MAERERDSDGDGTADAASGAPPSHPPAPSYGPPPAHAPPGYPPPGYVVYAPGPRTNGLAIASLVLGIVWIYWIGSILALVFGYVAKRQIDRSNGAESGRGLAIAGIVLGWIGIGVLALILLLVFGAVVFDY